MSETAEHTPGPWTLNLCLDDGFSKSSSIVSDYGALMEEIAIIPHDDLSTEGVPEVRANARLIAAAPDLLEACEAAGDYFAAAEFASAPHDTGAILDTLRAAITKARKGT